jgi:mRNA interferase RelE/StbE
MKIFLSKDAEKSIKRLERKMRERIKSGIQKLPFGDIVKMQGYTDTYRLRVGDFRIIFDMHADKINIIDVLPRGESYKN